MPGEPGARKAATLRVVAAASPGIGAKSQRRAALLAAGLGVASCGPPTVDAQAVWIASRRGPGGERTLSIYDSGRWSERRVAPAEPSEEADRLPLLVELDPAGLGALVRAADGGWQHELGDSSGTLRAGFFDLVGGRSLPLALPAGREPDAVTFAAAGGALWWTDGCPAALQVVPTSPRVAVALAGEGAARAAVPLSWPLGGGCGERWGAVSASDAPVIYAVESVPADGSLQPGPGGQVIALAYPLPDAGRVDEPALTLLRGGRLPNEALGRMTRLRCRVDGPSCGLAVVDPDGDAITVAGGDDCRLWRWSRLDGATTCALPVAGSGEMQPWTLIAATAPDRYLFRQGLVFHSYQWTTGEITSRPLLGEDSELFTLPSRDGRTLTFATVRGPTLRASGGELEVLSVEQRACPGFQAPVASPDGRWVAWTCVLNGLDGDDGLDAGEVVRVSEAGMERFQGVPMWALAIDDAGNVLLHSRGDQEFSFELLLPPDPPRNLYVLSADGVLARIDPLEPNPELHRGAGDGVFRWIAAQGL